jgi:hypothetical protein
MPALRRKYFSAVVNILVTCAMYAPSPFGALFSGLRTISLSVLGPSRRKQDVNLDQQVIVIFKATITRLVGTVLLSRSSHG